MWGFTVRGSWKPNRNCNILIPTLMAISVVSFLFSRCSTGGPGAHSAGWWLSLLHLISIFYECTMGIFFTLSHFVSQFPPTRFPLITAIRMCHFLPVHHLEWHFRPGRRSNTTEIAPSHSKLIYSVLFAFMPALRYAVAIWLQQVYL